MGDYADWDEPKDSDPTWETKDGEVIPISELGDNHLYNILNMLRRKAVAKLVEVQGTFLTMPEPQGEIASMDFDRAFDEVNEMTWLDVAEDHPKWFFLVAEARRRGIVDEDFFDPNYSLPAELSVLDKVTRRK